MNATSALGWSLLHFLWQGTLIALLAKLVLSMLPRRFAAARYAVALGALALMPAASVLTLARAWVAAPPAASGSRWASGELQPDRSGHARVPTAFEAEASSQADAIPADRSVRVDAASASSLSPARSWKQRVDVLSPWIVATWALGVVALAARLLASHRAVRRLVRAPGEPVPEAVQAMLARLSIRLGVGRAVRVGISSLSRVPAVAGWFRPVILLPASALTGLSSTQLEMVLAHELAHVRRHDYLVNLLQTLVETLLFYHPAVWWLGARIREEREHCCDDLAVAACGSAPAYAEALLSMEELRRAPELALAFSRGSLVGRIERLLAPSARSAELFPRWIAGLSAVGVVFVLACTSGLAEAARAGQREEHKSERSSAPQVPTHAGEVLLHPDPAQPLAERSAWARRAAEERRFREYWVGHSIAPSPSFQAGILMGSFDHTGGLVLGDGEDTITLSGGLLMDPENLELPGVPLAPLVGAAPEDVAVLYLWSGTTNRAAIRRVHLATARLPVDLEGLPVLWLGGATDRESVAETLALLEKSRDAELGKDLVGVVGAHADSALVVPELARILGSSALDAELRGDAAEWLARHPGREALQALVTAARGDGSGDVRSEAAESVAEMRYGPAFDALVALARELDDHEARLEAVEGLGQRSEPAAVPALLELAEGDPDEDVQSEAVETLGEVEGGAGLAPLASLARAHRSIEVRREAIETYGECAPADEALGFLNDLAERDPDPDARCEAVETLGELHDERVVAALRAIVETSPHAEVQAEAVETLGETILGAAVAPVLEQIARTHPVVDVQREAVETLGDLSDEENRVMDVVAAIAGDHPSEDVRAEAVETIADHCRRATAERLFDRLLKTERSPRVRKEIEQALEQLREGH